MLNKTIAGKNQNNQYQGTQCAAKAQKNQFTENKIIIHHSIFQNLLQIQSKNKPGKSAKNKNQISK